MKAYIISLLSIILLYSCGKSVDSVDSRVMQLSPEQVANGLEAVKKTGTQVMTYEELVDYMKAVINQSKRLTNFVQITGFSGQGYGDLEKLDIKIINILMRRVKVNGVAMAGGTSDGIGRLYEIVNTIRQYKTFEAMVEGLDSIKIGGLKHLIEANPVKARYLFEVVHSMKVVGMVSKRALKYPDSIGVMDAVAFIDGDGWSLVRKKGELTLTAKVILDMLLESNAGKVYHYVLEGGAVALDEVGALLKTISEIKGASNISEAVAKRLSDLHIVLGTGFDIARKNKEKGIRAATQVALIIRDFLGSLNPKNGVLVSMEYMESMTPRNVSGIVENAVSMKTNLLKAKLRLIKYYQGAKRAEIIADANKAIANISDVLGQVYGSGLMRNVRTLENVIDIFATVAKKM